MQEESITKQELEDRTSIRKVSLISVSKDYNKLIKTSKSEIDKFFLEYLAHFK